MKRISLLIVLLIYLLTRLAAISTLPIFIDEALYLMLGNQIKQGLQNPWIALFHGNPPFFSWYLSMLLRIFQFDPLLIGRLSSVFLGLVVIVLLYYIGLRTYSIRVGILSALLYTLSPFSLIYDRLTLIEPLLQVWAIIILFLISSKNINYKKSIITGIILGIALLTKASAYSFLILVTLIIIIGERKRMIYHILIISFLALIVSSVVRINPLYYNLEQFNRIFITSLPEFLQNPSKNVIPNLNLSLKWTSYYWGIGLFILIIYGFLLSLKFKKYQFNLAIVIWIFVVLVSEIFSAKIFYPRYFFFLTSFICLSAAISLDLIFKKFPSKFIFSVIILLVMLPSLYNDYRILKDIKSANLPAIERWQFLESWPAGYGIDKMLKFVEENSKSGKTELIVEKYNLPYFVLNLYQSTDNNLIISDTLSLVKLSNNLNDYTATNLPQKFIILNQLQKLPDNWNVKLVGKYTKVANKTSIYIYKIIL